jgi:hypothetical protein
MNSSAELTLEVDEALRAELRAGEELWYAGMPAPKYAGRKMIPIAVFGLFFGGFAAFWITMAAAIAWFGSGAVDSSSDPSQEASNGGAAAAGFAILFPLFGLPFLAIGIGMISSPWRAARAARNTGCFVTNERALRIKVGRSIKVESWGPADLGEISKVLYRDGRGCVIFAQRLHAGAKGRVRTVQDGFDGIPEPRACEEALLALKAGAVAESGARASDPDPRSA